MKPLIFTLSLLALTGCTITRQAQVSEASPISGIVRLTYNQPLFLLHGQMIMYLTDRNTRMPADGLCRCRFVWSAGRNL